MVLGRSMGKEKVILSSAEPWFTGLRVRIGVPAVGSVLTIAFAFWQRWELAAGVCFGAICLAVCAWALKLYRDQVHEREGIQQSEFNAALEAREATIAKGETELEQKEQEFHGYWQGVSNAITALHTFIHICRDEAVALQEGYDRLWDGTERDRGQLLTELRDMGKRFLERAMGRMLDVFQPLAYLAHGEPVVIWAAIREIRPAPGFNEYHTSIRAGAYNPKRVGRTEPIAEHTGIPLLLREAYLEGGGIVILRPDDPRRPKIYNDTWGENKSIMAGPIICLRKDIPQMPMYVALNSPKNGAFEKSMKPYLRCCTDCLSAVMNSFPEILIEIQESDDSQEGA